ncbi:hypothetical protein HYDPIDRAFT_155522 [Hydnomerulius pinastri MD-312]|uniref:Secreted protein n=1 Tax=Hydnomerulius pinastri MD-312 TaxID=994086 RepID=A0A0C9VD02_9AGAM|nr:hypothetical protein HYDPIDRAFT_155522 [Hydnomerulius pinastri MD-312]
MQNGTRLLWRILCLLRTIRGYQLPMRRTHPITRTHPSRLPITRGTPGYSTRSFRRPSYSRFTRHCIRHRSAHRIHSEIRSLQKTHP